MTVQTATTKTSVFADAGLALARLRAEEPRAGSGFAELLKTQAAAPAAAPAPAPQAGAAAQAPAEQRLAEHRDAEHRMVRGRQAEARKEHARASSGQGAAHEPSGGPETAAELSDQQTPGGSLAGWYRSAAASSAADRKSRDAVGVPRGRAERAANAADATDAAGVDGDLAALEGLGALAVEADDKAAGSREDLLDRALAEAAGRDLPPAARAPDLDLGTSLAQWGALQAGAEARAGLAPAPASAATPSPGGAEGVPGALAAKALAGAAAGPLAGASAVAGSALEGRVQPGAWAEALGAASGRAAVADADDADDVVAQGVTDDGRGQTREPMPRDADPALAVSAGNFEAATGPARDEQPGPPAAFADNLAAQLGLGMGLGAPAPPRDGGVQMAAISTVPVSAAIETAVQDPGFVDTVSLKLLSFAREGVQQATLQLNPAEMGPVDVSIALAGDTAQIGFSAIREDTRAALAATVAALTQTFQADGLALTDVRIEAPAMPDAAGDGMGSGDGNRGSAGDYGSDRDVDRSFSGEAGQGDRGARGGAGHNDAPPRDERFPARPASSGRMREWDLQVDAQNGQLLGGVKRAATAGRLDLYA